MPSEVIVALDFDEERALWSCLGQLNPEHCMVKVGSELFTALGPSVVRRCIAEGFRIFLDLKFHDIPTTVAAASQVAADMGVWMFNVHASGGMKMLEAARVAIDAYGAERPRLIAVTVLTSQHEQTLQEVGIDTPLAAQVKRLAKLTYDAGLDGVVCSGFEVPELKQVCGPGFLTVTPGIRLSEDTKDDQVRVLSPLEAQQKGCDYMVIGRSITRSPTPGSVLETIYADLRRE